MLRKIMDVNQLLRAAPNFSEDNIQEMIQQLKKYFLYIAAQAHTGTKVLHL